MAKFKRARDIKTGVIGYSSAFNMGKHHLESMKLAGMTPTAVAELDASRLAAAAADFPGIETYTTVAQMLKQSQVNLLVIITPHNTHAKIALQCLRAGRHVVCEKPMAVTTAECDRMIAEARKRRLMLSAFHNRHWDGCILQAVKLIRRGTIGDVHRVEAHLGRYGKPGDWWRSSKSVSGGILYDWGVHFLEYTLQIVDSPIMEVSGFAHEGLWAAKTPWKGDVNEDEASVVVRFKSGAWLDLTVTQMDAAPLFSWFHITGTKGSLSFDHNDWKLTPMRRSKPHVREGRSPPGQWHKYYRNVSDHLAKGAPLIITGEYARRPIHVLDLAVRSAKAGKAMKAKYG